MAGPSIRRYSAASTGTDQDVPLDDIDRIEVIRGPGATIWGANAVNGVINIITKKAKDSQGAMATYGGGTEYLGGAAHASAGKSARISTGASAANSSSKPRPTTPRSLQDAWRQGRTGFRADWEPDRDKSNLVHRRGRLLSGLREFEVATRSPFRPTRSLRELRHSSGGDLLARWTHTYDERSDWQLQTYFDQQQYLNPALRQTKTLSTRNSSIVFPSENGTS